MKAVFQGSSYKKTLQTHLNKVKELTTMMNQEAGALLHHRVQHIEEYVHNIERMLRELQADKKSIQNDQNMVETIGTSILDVLKELLVNGTFSLLTSSAGIASKSIKGLNIIGGPQVGED